MADGCSTFIFFQLTFPPGRRLLAFLRTSLAFFLVGVGLIKFLNHPVLDVIGLIFIVLGGIFLIWGVQRYRQVRKVLREVTPEDQ